MRVIMKWHIHSLFFALFVSVVLFGCEEDPVVTTDASAFDSTKVKAQAAANCGTCKYVVPANTSTVDAKALGIKPGDVICFSSSMKYTTSVTFKNVVGTKAKPVVVTNCGGKVTLTVSGKPINVKFSNSKHFRFTGGNVDGEYGIRMSGSKSNGLVLCDLSTDFEVDHIEVHNVGFAGIMAKTDPTCDDATNRGNFTMRNIYIHDNYIHHTGGEGMYIGHSFYGGYTLSCGVKLPHTIENSFIYRNKVTETAWDGIQVGCATKNANIYENTIQNAGTAKKSDQNYGMILSSGTGGRCYGNFIKGGTGTGLAVFGLGENMIYNNIIVSAGKDGIFTDERTDSWGYGYRVMNNTIVNPKEVGIRMYGEKVPKNIVMNNIVVNPGAYATKGENSYIMKVKASQTNLEAYHNILTRKIGDLKFVDTGKDNYRLTSSSPAREKGKDVSIYDIPKDFYGDNRLKGAKYDIGADEY